MIEREETMLRKIAVTIALALTVSVAQAQSQKRSGMRFWNLTLYTLTSLQFSPPGQNTWGKNQCENDDDKTVDHDERLRITGLTPGRYDAKLADKIGRTCIVKNVEVKDGVFSIEEKQLTDCQQK
jgi:hypothetical protein